MRRLIIAFVVLLATWGASQAQTLPVPSTWLNQRGSILTITTIDTAGNLKGTFVNNAAGFSCKGTPYDVAGAVKGADLFFYVTFGPCNTITVWRGRMKGAEISTQWELKYVDSAKGQFADLKGSDDFKKQ